MSTKRKTAEEIKQKVKEKYSQISEQSAEYNTSSCCGAGGGSDEVYNIMTDDYSEVKGTIRMPIWVLLTQLCDLYRQNSIAFHLS